MTYGEQAARNERLALVAIRAANIQGRCGACGRVRADHEYTWRTDIYGQPMSPLCVDVKGCVRFSRFLADHACGGIPNMADQADYAPN